MFCHQKSCGLKNVHFFFIAFATIAVALITITTIYSFTHFQAIGMESTDASLWNECVNMIIGHGGIADRYLFGLLAIIFSFLTLIAGVCWSAHAGSTPDKVTVGIIDSEDNNPVGVTVHDWNVGQMDKEQLQLEAKSLRRQAVIKDLDNEIKVAHKKQKQDDKAALKQKNQDEKAAKKQKKQDDKAALEIKQLAAKKLEQEKKAARKKEQQGRKAAKTEEKRKIQRKRQEAKNKNNERPFYGRRLASTGENNMAISENSYSSYQPAASVAVVLTGLLAVWFYRRFLKQNKPRRDSLGFLPVTERTSLNACEMMV